MLLSDDVFGAASTLDKDALRGIHGGSVRLNMCDYMAVVLGRISYLDDRRAG